MHPGQTRAVTQVLERITGQDVDPNGRLAGVANRTLDSILRLLTELDEVSGSLPTRSIRVLHRGYAQFSCPFGWSLAHLSGCGW